MTGDEYATLIAYVTRLWPHAKFVEGQWQAAERFLLDLSLAEAMSAVDRLATEGREFPPPAGVIRREAVMIELLPLTDRVDDDVDIFGRNLARLRRLQSVGGAPQGGIPIEPRSDNASARPARLGIPDDDNA